MAAPFPTVDASRTRLQRAGWSIGETATASGWLVIGSNGENAISATGETQAEAWYRAVEQAEAVGMATKGNQTRSVHRLGM
jgi:hypothetical protein